MSSQKLIEELRKLRKKLESSTVSSPKRTGVSNATKKRSHYPSGNAKYEQEKATPHKSSASPHKYGHYHSPHVTNDRNPKQTQLSSKGTKPYDTAYKTATKYEPGRYGKQGTLPTTSVYNLPNRSNQAQRYTPIDTARSHQQAQQTYATRNPLTRKPLPISHFNFSDSNSTDSSDSLDYNFISPGQKNNQKRAPTSNLKANIRKMDFSLDDSSDESSSDDYVPHSQKKAQAIAPKRRSIFPGYVDSSDDTDSSDDLEIQELLKKFGQNNKRSISLSHNDQKRYATKYNEPTSKKPEAPLYQRKNAIMAALSDDSSESSDANYKFQRHHQQRNKYLASEDKAKQYASRNVPKKPFFSDSESSSSDDYNYKPQQRTTKQTPINYHDLISDSSDSSANFNYKFQEAKKQQSRAVKEKEQKKNQKSPPKVYGSQISSRQSEINQKINQILAEGSSSSDDDDDSRYDLYTKPSPSKPKRSYISSDSQLTESSISSDAPKPEPRKQITQKKSPVQSSNQQRAKENAALDSGDSSSTSELLKRVLHGSKAENISDDSSNDDDSDLQALLKKHNISPSIGAQKPKPNQKDEDVPVKDSESSELDIKSVGIPKPNENKNAKERSIFQQYQDLSESSDSDNFDVKYDIPKADKASPVHFSNDSESEDEQLIRRADERIKTTSSPQKSSPPQPLPKTPNSMIPQDTDSSSDTNVEKILQHYRNLPKSPQDKSLTKDDSSENNVEEISSIIDSTPLSNKKIDIDSLDLSEKSESDEEEEIIKKPSYVSQKPPQIQPKKQEAKAIPISPEESSSFDSEELNVKLEAFKKEIAESKVQDKIDDKNELDKLGKDSDDSDIQSQDLDLLEHANDLTDSSEPIIQQLGNDVIIERDSKKDEIRFSGPPSPTANAFPDSSDKKEEEEDGFTKGIKLNYHNSFEENTSSNKDDNEEESNNELPSIKNIAKVPANQEITTQSKQKQPVNEIAKETSIKEIGDAKDLQFDINEEEDSDIDFDYNEALKKYNINIHELDEDDEEEDVPKREKQHSNEEESEISSHQIMNDVENETSEINSPINQKEMHSDDEELDSIPKQFDIDSDIEENSENESHSFQKEVKSTTGEQPISKPSFKEEEVNNFKDTKPISIPSFKNDDDEEDEEEEFTNAKAENQPSRPHFEDEEVEEDDIIQNSKVSQSIPRPSLVVEEEEEEEEIVQNSKVSQSIPLPSFGIEEEEEEEEIVQNSKVSQSIPLPSFGIEEEEEEEENVQSPNVSQSIPHPSFAIEEEEEEEEDIQNSKVAKIVSQPLEKEIQNSKVDQQIHSFKEEEKIESINSKDTKPPVQAFVKNEEEEEEEELISKVLQQIPNQSLEDDDDETDIKNPQQSTKQPISKEEDKGIKFQMKNIIEEEEEDDDEDFLASIQKYTSTNGNEIDENELLKNNFGEEEEKPIKVTQEDLQKQTNEEKQGKYMKFKALSKVLPADIEEEDDDDEDDDFNLEEAMKKFGITGDIDEEEDDDDL